MRLWIFFGLVLCAECSPLLHTNLLYRSSLYEGSPCQMEDGRPGICKRMSDCPLRVIELLQGQRGPDSAGRCGFDGDTEIVCCLKNCQYSRRLADLEQLRALAKQRRIRRSDAPRPRRPVVHGTRAKPEELPFIAALGYRNGEGKIEYTCAGTLITEYHVLTAAHCVHNTHYRVPVEVRLGDVNLRLQKPTTQRIAVKSFIWHEKHSRFKYYNDIAVITLAEAASFNNRVWPICLPTDYRWKYSTAYSLRVGGDPMLIVAGWGATNPTGPLSNVLIKSPGLSLVDLKICGGQYQNAASLSHGIIEGMLCAVDRNSSRRADACRGDSGSPLFYQTQSGHTLFGVTAFGQGCGGSIPGIYTAVYPYIEWIEKHTWGAHGFAALESEEPKCESTKEKEEEMGNGEKDVKENVLERDREREIEQGKEKGTGKDEGLKKQEIEKDSEEGKKKQMEMGEGSEKDEDMKKQEENKNKKPMRNEGKEREEESQSGDGEYTDEMQEVEEEEATEKVEKDEEKETAEEMYMDKEEETTEETQQDEEEETTDEMYMDEEEETTEDTQKDEEEETTEEMYTDEQEETTEEMQNGEEAETKEETQQEEEEETAEKICTDEEEGITEEMQKDEEEETEEKTQQEEEEEEEEKMEKHEEEEQEEEIEKFEKGEMEAEIEEHEEGENEEVIDMDEKMKKQKAEKEEQVQNEIELEAYNSEEGNDFNEEEPATVTVHS